MLVEVLLISLMITGIYKAFEEGNFLSPVRVWVANMLDNALGKKWSKYVQKPLWSCIPCMVSVWGILFSWSFNVPMLLAICGVNVIIERVIGSGELIIGEASETVDVPTLRRGNQNY